jgi:hypothetical protein
VGSARPRSSGEESSLREGGGEGENRLAMLLTVMWSSKGTCSTAESGGAAMVRRRRLVARVCEARRRLRG